MWFVTVFQVKFFLRFLANHIFALVFNQPAKCAGPAAVMVLQEILSKMGSWIQIGKFLKLALQTLSKYVQKMRKNFHKS